MNANYQHLSISAAAILLTIFVVTLIVFRAQAPSTDLAAEQTADFSSQTSPDDSSFAPFQAADSNTPADISKNNNSTQAPIKPRILRTPPRQAQPVDQFAQFPRNAPGPPIDFEAEVPLPPPTVESIRRNREQRWAAKLSAEQEAKIDAVIDAAEQRHIETMANNLNRRTAIQTVDLVTQLCFEELYTRAPDAAGRIIVNFEVIGEPGGRGIFENVHIASNYNLNDMAFEACIVAAIQSATFKALNSESVWVEHALHTTELP